ncbi:CHAD domain-containing protein [Rathayibacter sp. CAU 1779]
MPSSDDAEVHPVARAEATPRDPDRFDPPSAADTATAAEVLRTWWLAEVGELAGFEARTRAGQADALHQARVRVRALRSVASVYRRVFDRRTRRTLEAPLKVYGAVLGAARDAEVREQALGALLDSAENAGASWGDRARDDGLVAALGALRSDALSEADSATQVVLQRLDSADHASLMLRLTALVVDAPAGPAGDHPMEAVARGELSRAATRVSHRAVSALRPSATLEQLHELRKACRRLRYAAEAAGTDAERLAEAAEAVQNALGDHRDGVLLAGELWARADSEKQSTASALRNLAEKTDAAARDALSTCGELLAALTAEVQRLR